MHIQLTHGVNLAATLILKGLLSEKERKEKQKTQVYLYFSYFSETGKRENSMTL